MTDAKKKWEGLIDDESAADAAQLADTRLPLQEPQVSIALTAELNEELIACNQNWMQWCYQFDG